MIAGRSSAKVVPASVFEAPDYAVQAFLRGLFDADGCVVDDEEKGTRYVGLGSRSENLLRGVQELLASMGIASRIYNAGTKSESFTYVRKDGSTAIARTPRGTFRVGYVVDGRDEGFLGEMWRPRYFNGGYAVHGSPSIPAHPASHGCARVSNAAMDMIWGQNHMPKGSTVLVR